MRHTKLILYAFLLSILSFSFINPKPENIQILLPSSQSTDVFLLGAWGNEADSGRQYITDPDGFGMNLWHTLTINNEQ